MNRLTYAFAIIFTCIVIASCGGGGGVSSGAEQGGDDGNQEADATAATGSIEGVVGQGGLALAAGKLLAEPVSKAGVDLTALAVTLEGAGHFETQPDAVGKFSFSSIPAGTYILSIKPGEAFPQQAYYPKANITVKSGVTLNLSVPVVRGISANIKDYDLQALVIDSNNGSLLLFDNNKLIKVSDMGPGQDAVVESHDVGGRYLGKDDGAGLFYTINITETEKRYDLSWGSAWAGTSRSCSIHVYDSSYDAANALNVELGSKNVVETSSACGAETCRTYRDEANCPLSSTIDDSNHRAYFLAELTTEDKIENGVSKGRKLVTFEQGSSITHNYLVSADAQYAAADKRGNIYVIDESAGEVEVVGGPIDKMVSVGTLSYYKNGIQPVLDYEVNLETGDLFLIYPVNSVGTTSIEPWLLIANASGQVLLDKNLFEVLGGDASFDLSDTNSFSTFAKSSGSSSGGSAGAGLNGDVCTEQDVSNYLSYSKNIIKQITIMHAKESIVARAQSGRGYLTGDFERSIWKQWDNYRLIDFAPDSKSIIIGGMPFSMEGFAFDAMVPESALPIVDKMRCYHNGPNTHFAYSCDEDNDPQTSCTTGLFYGNFDPQWSTSGLSSDPTPIMDLSRGFAYKPSDQNLSINRYSVDMKDIDVSVGLLFVNQVGLKGLTVNRATGRIYTFDPNSGEIIVIE